MAILLATATTCICQNTNRKIIDVHFHELRWNSFGKLKNKNPGIYPFFLTTFFYQDNLSRVAMSNN
jgi:hypothetical protein